MIKKLQSINPFTEELNGKVDLISEDKVEILINTAHNAFITWKDTSFDERKKLFLALADEIEKDIDECAKLQTIEMGMLYSDSKAGMQGTANLIRWFANNAEKVLGEKKFQSDEGFHGIEKHDPLGVIFGIAPWNFPFNQLLRAAVPNILAGNTQLYKHSSNVPLCAQKIQDLFDAVGFPKGVYTNLFVPSAMSEYIISHKYIAGVNLTGSEGAGSAVGSLAGKYLKPCILELGGNDAFIVGDTDDIDNIVEQAVLGRIRNGGQACNASKRFIVLEKYYDEFCKKYVEKMQSLVIGDPMIESTQLQPLATQRAVEDVDMQVKNAISSGATLLTGGKILDKKGFFYAPTVLVDVTENVSSFNQEIFGPVATIYKSKNIDESIALANNSDFGLSACIFGDNKDQIRSAAKQLTGGMIFINSRAGSKASLPFGGVKKSGFGKENGAEGLLAFTNKKVILY